jgi:hypothetical protein
MKHLRVFESDINKIKVTRVDFSDGDVSACYVDDILEFYGNYYDDKIGDKIGGFVLGLKYFKKSYIYNIIVDFEIINCDDEELNIRVSEYGDPPPKDLKDINRVNELLGIGKTIRRLKYEHEVDAEELEHLIDTNKIFDLEYSEKKVKEEFIKIFSFKIETHRSFVEYEDIRVEFSNWLHPIKTPGLTDYNVYYNDKIMNVSRRKAKEIYNKLRVKFKK